MMTANIHFDISKRKIPLFWDGLKRHAQEFYFLSGASTHRQLGHLPSCSNTVPFLYRGHTHIKCGNKSIVGDARKNLSF